MKILNSKLAAMALGEQKVIAGAAKIILTDNSHHLPDGTKLKKYMIAGAMLTDSDIEFNGNWNMLECDIVLVPKRRFTEWKEDDGATIEQVLCSGYDKPENWEREINLF